MAALSAAAFGVHQGAEVVETISGDAAPGDKFPEAVFDFAGEAVGGADDVGEEAGTFTLQSLHDVAGGVGKGYGMSAVWVIVGCGHEPGGIFAQEERDGGDPGGADNAVIEVRRMGGEPAPHDFAGEAEFVQEVGLVFGDTAGEDFGFPDGGRGFVALQLADEGEGSIGSVELGSGGGVLPLVEEAFEVSGGDGFDFAAEFAESGAVYAGENTTVTPFGVSGLAPVLSLQD